MFTDWTAFLNDRDQLLPMLCPQILFIWHHSIREVLLITNRDRFKRTSLSLSPRGPLVAGDLISPHPHPHSDLLACLLSGHKLRNSTIWHHRPLKAELWQQTRQRKTDLSMRSVKSSKSLPRLPIATKTSSRQKCSYPHTSSLPHHHLDCTKASNQHWNLIDLAILCSYIKRNKPLIPEIQTKTKLLCLLPWGQWWFEWISLVPRSADVRIHYQWIIYPVVWGGGGEFPPLTDSCPWFLIPINKPEDFVQSLAPSARPWCWVQHLSIASNIIIAV